MKKDISKRKKIDYGVEVDLYICHNDRKLIPTSITHRKFVCGYESEATLSECEFYDNCMYKNKMTK